MEVAKKTKENILKWYEVIQMFSEIVSNEVECEKGVQTILETMGRTYGFSAITVREIVDEPQSMRYLGEYQEDMMFSKLHTVRKYTDMEWSVLMNHFKDGIYVYSIKDGSQEQLINVFDSESNIISVVQVPLYHKKRFMGVIDFLDYCTERDYQEEELNLIQTIAYMISNYLVGNKAFYVLKEEREELDKKDKLTGLIKYEYFVEKLAGVLDETLQEHDIAIIYTDISRFKSINENYGISAGDELICSTAKLLGGAYEEDYLFTTRVFSDNFITACKVKKNITNEEMLEIAKRLNVQYEKQLKQQFFGEKIILNTGINIIRSADDNVNQIITNADFARKEAKRSETDKCQMFTENMLQTQLEQTRLIAALPKAIKNKELKVYYQPKVETGTGRAIGGEALIRWQKEDGSFIYPNQFIPIFEEKGNIAEVDFFVYREVFATIRKRLDNGQPVVPISMNVSRVHLQRQDFLPYIKSLFREYKIPGQYVEFELTESMYIESMEQMMPLLEELHKLGVKVSMDDFGSGYSSLNLLTTIPIDVIKIDQVFMQHDQFEEKEKIILSCIIEMAKRLHITALCEGVEKIEQSKYLTKIGCDIFQGYLFAKPMPADDFYKYVEEHICSEVKEIRFTFDGTLYDTTKEYKAKMKGNDITFTDGPVAGTHALYLPGGARSHEILELPTEIMENISYTINMWYKEDEPRLWSSVFYVRFANGFASVMPRGWEMKASFRVKEDNCPTWFDAGTGYIEDNQWNMMTVSYDAESNTTNVYVNGHRMGILEDVPCLKNAKEIILGGDIYTESFKGLIYDLRIFNQSLSGVEIKKMFDEIQPVRFQVEEEEDIEKKSTCFDFDGTLQDDKGVYTAKYLGEEVQFAEGRKKGTKCIYFPGGSVGENIVELPIEIWEKGSFSISIWVKTDQREQYISLYYAKFANIFHQIMPEGWDGRCVYRTRKKEETEESIEWYDLAKRGFVFGEWSNITITFEKKTNITGMYINGEAIGYGKSIELGDADRIVLGGDKYQKSFQGYVDKFTWFNHALNVEEVKELYWSELF